MCERLGELADAMRRYSAGFDPSVLSCEAAAVAVQEAATIEAVAAAVKGFAAARAAEGGLWRAAGDRSAAHHLARTTGTSVTQAAETLDTARALATLEVAGAAARAGELSAQLVAAASAEPSAQARLVATAARVSLGDLRQECARVRAAALPDAEARRRGIHAGRHLRTWTDADGAWNLRMRDNPEVGAQIMASLDAIRDRLFREARAAGRTEPTEAYAADALVELAGGRGGARQARAKVIVRVDLEACCAARPSQARCASWPGSGRSPSRRCGTCSTPAIPSWPRW